jgi:hypothetical protein
MAIQKYNRQWGLMMSMRNLQKTWQRYPPTGIMFA